MFIEINGIVINTKYFKRTSEIFKMSLSNQRAFYIYMLDSQPIIITSENEEKALQKLNNFIMALGNGFNVKRI